MERLHRLTKTGPRQEGQLLIEILIAIALTAILLPALLTGLLSSNQGKIQQAQRARAVALMKEAEEVVRNVRNQGWEVFSVNGTYHPMISGDSWTFASGNETIGDLVRIITVSDVYRDSNGIIVETGGAFDPATKRVDIEVSWEQPYHSAVESTLYVTRYLDNAASLQTSVEEFDQGVYATTESSDTSGGEVTLSTNTKGQWCSPAFSPANITLPDGPPVAVAATSSATSITDPNRVFVITSPTNSNSIKLTYHKVTADGETPAPSNAGIFTLDPTRYSSPGLVPSGIGLDNNFRTNDVTYYTSSTGKVYALIATNKPDKEVIAILIDDNNDSNNNTNDGEFQDYQNGIYKYWTFYNTQMYELGSSTGDTGFVDPGSNAAEPGGDNNGFNSNSTRAYTNNSSYAVDSNSGSGTGTNCAGNDKDRHRYYGYDFNIPTGASINGIEVRLDALVDSTSGTPRMCVQLSWDGGSTWTSTKLTNTLSTSQQTYLLGGASDTWGRTWSDAELSNSNFRLRITNIASNTSRDFSLDWAAVRVYHAGGTLNDQAPFGYGATSLAVLEDRGYVTSGGYLYTFDLSNIDTKSPSSGLDMVGCRIQLDGYDCSPGSPAQVRKYNAGQSGTSWGDASSAIHNTCEDGGNIELYATNDIFPLQVGSNTYVYVAVGGVTNPEFEIVNVTNVPTTGSSPTINNNTCGRISGGNAGWKVIGSHDFNSDSGTEEAANSVYASGDGTRAYISSNGGIDSNNDNDPDSNQFYILNTSNKSNPTFLSGTPSSGATSGYYYGSGPDAQLYPRRSLTVLSGQRAVLVGNDGVTDSNNGREYQVLNISNESNPFYCGGLQFDQGFNDLTSVSELDGDNFVYMVGNTTANVLRIIQGGPDGTYLSPGTYESPVTDLGSVGALNRLSVTSSTPPGTTLQFQVAATQPTSGSCDLSQYVFVGPDGTGNTYYPSTGGAIPLSGIAGFSNPAQCVKYKAYFSTTDNNVTPTIYDASFNYSP